MIKNLFNKKQDFFDLFDKHAATMEHAGQLMYEAVNNLSLKEEKVAAIEKYEHDCDDIAHETINLLRHTFITPLDHDEIMLLVSRLDDIIDYLDAAAHRLILFEITEVPTDFISLCEVLMATQNQVTNMVGLLRTMKKTDEFSQRCMEINRLENKGDQLHRQGIAALFHRYQTDPLMVIKFKEMYEMLESAIDRCEDVANIVESIVMEHS